MAFKIVTLFALFAIAAAGPLEHYHQKGYQQEQAYQPQVQQHEYQSAPVIVKKFVATPSYEKQQDYESGPAEYDFNYAVNDEHTGDIKSQQESRKGDHVVGQYRVIDADGYRRIVDYTSDEHNGFQATVRREPVDGYKQPSDQKYVQTPVVKKYVEPTVEINKYVEAVTQKYVQAPVALNYVQSPKYSTPIAKIVSKVPIVKYVASVDKYVDPVSKYTRPSVNYLHQSAPVASQAQYDAYHKAQYEEAAPVHNYHY